MCRLFSLTSRTTLRRFLAFGLAFACLIALDPLCGWVISHATDQAPAILSGHSSQGVLYFCKLHNNGVTPIIFTGSSQMQTAGDPVVFEQTIKGLSGPVVSA